MVIVLPLDTIVEAMELVAIGEVLAPLCPLMPETLVEPVGLVADVEVLIAELATLVPRICYRIS